jgi:hypothetical protein
VLFCHGSPRSDEEILTAITPPKRLDPILDGVTQDVVRLRATRTPSSTASSATGGWVNAGSVGMAYEGEPGIAAWVLLGRPSSYAERRTTSKPAARSCRETGFPDADELVNEALLHPPSAEEVTAHFESLAERQSL